MSFSISVGTQYHAELIREICLEAIDKIAQRYYSEKQINAWKARILAKDWKLLIEEQHVLIAFDNETAMGFISLQNHHIVDFLYVSPQYSRQGVAQQLYNQLEAIAQAARTKKLTVMASKAARPFFEKNQFEVIRTNEVNLSGIVLENYQMAKML